MKGYKHLTQEQKQAILATYDRTLSTRITAEEVGVPFQRVQLLLKKHGIQLSGATNGACYRHIDDVRQWAKEGVSYSEIARRIGTTHHKVSAFLAKHGIEHKPYQYKPEDNYFWRGGRIVDDDGYILVKSPDHPYKDRHGYVREHRLVMEQQLGRYLLPTEVVHHGPGGKQDNSPENLKVFGSNGEHLAETLKDQTPQWSEEGKVRISKAVSQANKRRESPNRLKSGRYGSLSQYIDDQKQA